MQFRNRKKRNTTKSGFIGWLALFFCPIILIGAVPEYLDGLKIVLQKGTK